MSIVIRDTGMAPGRRRRGCGCLPLFFAALIVGLLLAGYGYSVYQAAWPRLTAGRAHLEHGLAILQTDPPTAITPELLNTARGDFAEAAADFRAVRETAAPLLALAPALGWVPQVGGDLTQAPGLLALGVDGGALGVALIDGVPPAVAQMQSGALPPDVVPAGGLTPLIDALAANPDALARAQQGLAAVK